MIGRILKINLSNKMNKTIGVLLLVVLGITVLGGISGAGGDFYTVMGLGFFILGIWGGVLLIKS